MNLFNKDKKENVDEQKFEERSALHAQSTEHFMEMHRMSGSDPNFMQLEFFFFTMDAAKADDLCVALQKLLYEVRIEENSFRAGMILITGTTTRIKNDDSVMEEWVKNMNELGYIHDCDFDGWGSTVEFDGTKGGWFSDDVTDEEIRKRMGLPPREEE